MLVKFNELSSAEQKEFTDSFYDACPCPTKETKSDLKTPDPLGKPWTYGNGNGKLRLNGNNAKEWGEQYYKWCAKTFTSVARYGCSCPDNLKGIERFKYVLKGSTVFRKALGM